MTGKESGMSRTNNWDSANNPYREPSMYGKMVREQNNLRPRYAEPGYPTGKMVASVPASKQLGPVG